MKSFLELGVDGTNHGTQPIAFGQNTLRGDGLVD